jgi:hypothetical protein
MIIIKPLYYKNNFKASLKTSFSPFKSGYFPAFGGEGQYLEVPFTTSLKEILFQDHFGISDE